MKYKQQRSVTGINARHRQSSVGRGPVLAWLLVLAFTTSSGLANLGLETSRPRLEIRGLGSMLPLAQRVAEAYMTEHPGAIVVVARRQTERDSAPF